MHEQRGGNIVSKKERAHHVTDIKCSFFLTGPQIFQEGDIVEIQMSFIIIPLRDQKSRMSIVLQSINLLDGQFTQVSKVCQRRKLSSKERTESIHKRHGHTQDKSKTLSKKEGRILGGRGFSNTGKALFYAN